MPIFHKFLNCNFGNGFATNNAILNVLPYEPEIIFIGTFNPDIPWNDADFFYGRGMYMWTILGNLFLFNNNHLTQRRTPPPLGNNTPTLQQIFEICEKGTITFADIILETKPSIPAVLNEESKYIFVNNTYNWNDYKDSHLDYMGGNGWLSDNVQNIIHYINNKPSIKYVYFTFKSGVWLSTAIRQISAGITPIHACSVFTPTGNGFGNNFPTPFDQRAWSIGHCWVWNGLPHAMSVNKPGFCHLDHDWLIRHGVNPGNF